MDPIHNGTGTKWTWYTTGLGHSGHGTQRDWYTTGLVHNRDTTGLGHNGTGTQRDWDTTGLVHTAGLGHTGHNGTGHNRTDIQWDRDTKGLVHNGIGHSTTGTKWDWDTIGLVHNGIGHNRTSTHATGTLLASSSVKGHPSSFRPYALMINPANCYMYIYWTCSFESRFKLKKIAVKWPF